MLEFYDDGNGCRPTVKITDTGSMSTYQKLCYVLDLIEEVVEFVNSFQTQLDDLEERKEDSSNITSNRKLSETGDFTGTWVQESKSSVDARINNGQNLYQNVIDLINTNPELNIETFYGGFLASPIEPTVEDLGLITELVTDEIDCGFFVYPCICTI